MGAVAHAAPITVFNTGVNGSGTVLADGTVGDPHYVLTSVPGGSTTDIRVRTSAGGFPIPPYIGDDGLSAWIGPNNDSQIDGGTGVYTFRTTFDLTGFNPATASLSISWSTDNAGQDVLLNGLSLGQTTSASQFIAGFSTFLVNSGFTSGINTLDFKVNNDGGPIGLRVEMSGNANAVSGVPEPASFVLFGAGLVGLVAARGRRRNLSGR